MHPLELVAVPAGGPTRITLAERLRPTFCDFLSQWTGRVLQVFGSPPVFGSPSPILGTNPSTSAGAPSTLSAGARRRVGPVHRSGGGSVMGTVGNSRRSRQQHRVGPLWVVTVSTLIALCVIGAQQLLHQHMEERGEPGPVLHWLRDGALAVPLVLVAVALTTLPVVRRTAARVWAPGQRRAGWSLTVAVIVGAGMIPGSVVHSRLFVDATAHEHQAMGTLEHTTIPRTVSEFVLDRQKPRFSRNMRAPRPSASCSHGDHWGSGPGNAADPGSPWLRAPRLPTSRHPTRRPTARTIGAHSPAASTPSANAWRAPPARR